MSLLIYLFLNRFPLTWFHSHVVLPWFLPWFHFSRGCSFDYLHSCINRSQSCVVFIHGWTLVCLSESCVVAGLHANFFISRIRGSTVISLIRGFLRHHTDFIISRIRGFFRLCVTTFRLCSVSRTTVLDTSWADIATSSPSDVCNSPLYMSLACFT